MNFEEAMAYLYSRLPVFHQIGHRAYKPGLETTRALCRHLDDPQLRFPTVHVAGTNGKGSVSNMLAAVLQQSGYKTGLYTSPHLRHFGERIRVNGQPVAEEYIASFVSENKEFIESVSPSFFEVTVAMAFRYFADQQVDIAVIEVGMGGRLDSTNVIHPVLSVITNIGLDHMRQLGNTLPEIAGEKAGIIKPGVPVVISERQEAEVERVFSEVAARQNAAVFHGSEYGLVRSEYLENGLSNLEIERYDKAKKTNTVKYSLDLTGSYQKKNLLGVLQAIAQLNRLGWAIPDDAVKKALSSVGSLTGFWGRWTRLSERPFVVADTAHNVPGLTDTIRQFDSIPAETRHFVLGFVGDKDVSAMLKLLPADGRYYFCAPSNARALPSDSLQEQASAFGLTGGAYSDVNAALAAAKAAAIAEDAIYVGGSTFVVADLQPF